MTRAVGLGLLSAATLLLELGLTRILSVVHWYHFAFLVLSTAMLGFGAGATLLSLRAPDREARPGGADWSASLLALGFAGTAAGGFLLVNALPLDPFRLGGEPRQWFYLLATILLLALPFACVGLAAGLLLLAARERVAVLYAWDLIGAAAGCLALPAALPLVGGVGALGAAALLGLLAAAFFAWPVERPFAVAAAVVALGGSALLPQVDSRVALRTAPGKVPTAVLSDPAQTLFTGWNSFSRVDVVRQPDPGVRGDNLQLWIDAGTAGSGLYEVTRPIGQLTAALKGARRRVEDPLLALTPAPRVLVLGSAGGHEVLSSLIAGARSVTAVEINPLVNRLVTGPFAAYLGNLFADPRVRLVTDDARALLARDRTQYDVILAVHTISNAAAAAGALNLAENSLLTREGFAAIADRLAPGGALLVTRPEAQLVRLFETALQDLRRRGVEPPGDCLIAFSKPETRDQAVPGLLAGLIYRNQPLSRAELDRLRESYERLGLHIDYPSREPPDRLELRELAEGRSEVLRFFAGEGYEFRPATDDRPFFNQWLRWNSAGLRRLAAAFTVREGSRLASGAAPVAEASVVAACVVSALAASTLFLLPLARAGRRALKTPGARAALLYFSAAGFGFMLVEVALAGRLTLLLGSPTYTLVVVLAGMLTASGLGSATLGGSRLSPIQAALVAAALVGLAAALIPVAVSGALGWPFGARVGVCLALVMPVGFALGAPLPLGLRRIARGGTERSEGGALGPWAWAANTFGSVVGASAAVLMALIWGYTASLLLAALVYLLAGLAARGEWTGGEEGAG